MEAATLVVSFALVGPLFKTPPAMLAPIVRAAPDSALTPVAERVATPETAMVPELMKVPVSVQAGLIAVLQAATVRRS
ncbi:MAG: hypothetical protein WDN08_05665 [Rhizomicrobium sp.]